MEDVRLKEEPWDPAELQHGLTHVKEEPVEVQLQEFPPVCVKTEDDEDDKSWVLHHRPAASDQKKRPAASDREDCTAGCSKEEQLKVENCRGDSEDERLQGADSGADSSWSWEPPNKRSAWKLKKGVRRKCLTVKPEDDDEESAELHHRPAARTIEDTNGEDCGADSEREQLKGADSGADSDWSWDWKPPIRHRVQSRGVRMAPPSPEIFYSSPVTVKTEDKSCVLRQTPAARTTEQTNGEEAGCSAQLHSDSEEEQLKGADSGTEEETEERPHKCSFCGKCFKNTSHFNQHLKIHSGEKPYSCSICKKAFLRSRTLTEHMRLHTGEKPFSCSVCKNDFTSKARMKKHMKIHTGEKPFSCPFCSKCFVQRSFLVIHIRQHTGEKPYSCTLCSRSYTDKSSLRKHMKKHRTCLGDDDAFRL